MPLHSCDGTFDQNCDLSRRENNIAGVLESAGQTSLLSYMDTYWKDIKGDDNDLWSHEWNKHGTCLRYDQDSLQTSKWLLIAHTLFPTAPWGPHVLIARARLLFSTSTQQSNFSRAFLRSTGSLLLGSPRRGQEHIPATRSLGHSKTLMVSQLVGLECKSKTLKEVYYYHHVSVCHMPSRDT